MRSRLRATIAGGAGAAVLAGVVVTVTAAPAGAAGFGANFVVYQVGDGSALTNAAAQVQLVEYSADGTSKLSTTALPTATTGSQHRLTAAGTSDSEGLLTLSADGRYLAFTGYDAAPGTLGPSGAALSASEPTSVPRTVGVAWAATAGAPLSVDTSTALSAAGTPSIPRSAVTTDGNRLWVTGGNGGVLATTRSYTSAVRVAGAAASNLTQLTIAGGQLFAAGVGDVTAPAAGATPAYNAIAAGTQVRTVGSGIPAAGTSAALAGVTGLPTITDGPFSYLPYGIAYLDLGAASYKGTGIDTAYVANGADRGGAVDKYVFDGTTFVRKGTVAVDGAFGIAASVSGGTVVLAVTTGDEVVTLTDPSAATSTLSATPQHLVSAPSGRVFRGIAVAPSVGSGPSAVPPTATIAAPTAGQSVAPYVTSLAVSGTAYSPLGISDVKVRIDGGAWRTATRSGTSWSTAVPLTGVATGAHTLTVSTTDASASHTAATATRSFTYAPVVVPAGAVGPGIVSANAAQVTRKGFTAASYPKAPGGKGAKAKKKGTASVRFVGRTVQVHLGVRKNAGKAKVIVDGKAHAVNLYGKKKKDLVVTVGGLAYGTHTVVVKALGKKVAKSKGTHVLLGWLQVVL